MIDTSLHRRNHYPEEEIRLAMGLLFLLNFLFALLAFNDFVLVTDWNLTLQVLGTRAVYFVVCLVFTLVVYRNPRTPWYGVLLVLEALALAALLFMAYISRPPESIVISIPIWVILAFTYFVLPASLLQKLLQSYAFSAITLYFLLFIAPPQTPGRFAFMVALLALNAVGTLGAFRSAVLREKAHRYRQSIEERFRFKQLLADSSFEAIVMHQGQKMVDWNRAFVELVSQVGVSEDQLAGMNLEDLIHCENLDSEQVEITGENLKITVDVQRQNLTKGQETFQVCLLRDRTPELMNHFMQTGSEPSKVQVEGRIEALPLSPREKKVVAELITGKTRLAIADDLYVSDETVKKHCANIYKKLGVNSRIDLMRMIFD